MNRKHKREKTKKWRVEREGGRAPTASDAAAVVFECTKSGKHIPDERDRLGCTTNMPARRGWDEKHIKTFVKQG
jgi:hypothetical protein